MEEMGAAGADPLNDPRFREPGFMERLRDALLGDRRPLDCAQIEVTSHCIGGCVYCPRETCGQSWQARHMDAAVFARLWPVLKNARRAHLQGWGEPFSHPRFFDFVALARKAGCQVSTTSSGMGMDTGLARKIADSGMDLVAFSLTGTDPVTNAARSKVDFKLVCQAISILRKEIDKQGRENSPEIHLAYLMLADRIDAVAALPGLMNRLDVEMAVISTLDYLAVPEQRQLAFAPQDIEKIGYARGVLRKAALEAEKDGRIIHYELPEANTPPGNGCRENIGKSLYIDAEGDVSPCVYLNIPGEMRPQTRCVFGNVLKEEPMAIWLKNDFAAFRNNLLARRPVGACVDCPKRHEMASF